METDLTTTPRPPARAPAARTAAGLLMIALAACLSGLSGGCATIRVTDPTHTATEQFLLTQAAVQAISQLSMDGLRDQVVYVDYTYLTGFSQPSLEHTFLLGELRSRLLKEGVRLTGKREQATVIVEVRSGGVGIDRTEFLLGIPASLIPTGSSLSSLPVNTPELAIVKSTKQRGFASVAIIAYRANDGSLLSQSGPFVGKTRRDDYWFFGTGPNTVGDIPPAEKR